eukprot:268976-Amphidinium_carterae.1
MASACVVGPPEPTKKKECQKIGSTSLWEATPQAMQRALRMHDTTIRKVLAAYDGYEVTTEGGSSTSESVLLTLKSPKST